MVPFKLDVTLIWF